MSYLGDTLDITHFVIVKIICSKFMLKACMKNLYSTNLKLRRVVSFSFSKYFRIFSC